MIYTLQKSLVNYLILCVVLKDENFLENKTFFFFHLKYRKDFTLPKLAINTLSMKD
jgi:hypothetical protein